MEYLFILGRNPELSIMELKSFFGDFKYKQVKNSILAEIPTIDNQIIKRFGGVISIGKVMDLSEIGFFDKNKLNYVVWDFSSETELERVRKILKEKFKEERVKATEKKISGTLELQSGEKVPGLSSKKLIDEQYFVFGNKFGKIIATCDYEDIERRDMEKPVRREKLAISPRLAKIMINLSKVKPGEILLDPFCGIGVILQEALLLGVKAIGVDNDKDAIEGIKENLEWYKFQKERYKLINGDSRKVNPGKAEVMVSEPDLGEILKKLPTEEAAKKTINDYEKLIAGVLNNLKPNISGRMVFTSPLIQTHKKKFKCNPESITNRTDLKVVKGFPIEEFRKNQIVGREIFVLEN